MRKSLAKSQLKKSNFSDYEFIKPRLIGGVFYWAFESVLKGLAKIFGFDDRKTMVEIIADMFKHDV